MKRKSGLTPMWTNRDIERWFNRFVDRAEEQFYKLLQRAGEEFVKVARESGKYDDHTGNLRSSIGYIIVADGKILTENFERSGKGTDKTTGINQASRLSEDLAKLYNKGFVLIGVAGMKYAVYVEAMENKDVITSAAVHAEEWIKEQSQILFNRLAEKGY